MNWEHKIIVAILLVGTTFTVLKTTQKPVRIRTIHEPTTQIKEMAATAIH